MSVVTNVLLKASVGDKLRIEKLNAAFQQGKPFVSCDKTLPRGWYAGDKFLECELCPGAFNYLNLAELVRAIQSIDWDDPGSVQLFVQEQEAGRLKEVDLEFRR